VLVVEETLTQLLLQIPLSRTTGTFEEMGQFAETPRAPASYKA